MSCSCMNRVYIALTAIIIIVCLFFFLFCCGDHRDLHSFPTRRSSDLGVFVRVSRTTHVSRPAASNVIIVGGATVRRSEEHTSELQSLRHLVCRLLLEKKKPRPRDPSSALPIARPPRPHGRLARSLATR